MAIYRLNLTLVGYIHAVCTRARVTDDTRVPWRKHQDALLLSIDCPTSSLSGPFRLVATTVYARASSMCNADAVGTFATTRHSRRVLVARNETTVEAERANQRSFASKALPSPQHLAACRNAIGHDHSETTATAKPPSIRQRKSLAQAPPESRSIALFLCMIALSQGSTWESDGHVISSIRIRSTGVSGIPALLSSETAGPSTKTV